MSLQFILENMLFGLFVCQIVSKIIAFLSFRVGEYLYLIGFTVFCFILYLNPTNQFSYFYALPFIYSAIVTFIINSNHRIKKISKTSNSLALTSLIFGFIIILLWAFDISIYPSVLALMLLGIFSSSPISFLLKNYSKFFMVEKMIWIVLWVIILTGLGMIFHYELANQPETYLTIAILLLNSFVFTAVYQFLSIYKLSINKIEEKNSSLFQSNLRIIKSNALLEKKLISSQDKALNNQINPHFIFNSINSIISLIYAREVTSSKKYLNDFSSLLKLILSENNTTFVSLENEIEILEKYVSLEKLRKKSPFHFKVEISSELNPKNIFIPRLFFQAHVENSIWHGFSEIYEIEDPTIELSVQKKTTPLE